MSLRTASCLLLASLTTSAIAAPRPEGTCVFIGTQESGPGQGIMATLLDPATGALAPPRLAAEVARPTWVLADETHSRLFAASDPRDAGPPRVLGYAVERPAGTLRAIGAVDPGGKGPTNLAFDPASSTVFVAHYNSGQVSALPVLPDGKLNAPASIATDSGSGPSPRQTSPHAHAAILAPGGRFVLVPDLGADRVFVYRFDPATRQLEPAATPFVALPPGSGPRHLVFHPNGGFAYLVSELSAEVRTYRFDARTGTLAELQVRPTSSPSFAGTKSAAEIAIARDGRHLYVSDRGENTIVTYAVDGRTRLLSEERRIAAGGQVPWSFGLDPTGRWMLVANQGSNSVAAFAVDARSGMLTVSPNRIAVSKPVSIAFLKQCR